MHIKGTPVVEPELKQQEGRNKKVKVDYFRDRFSKLFYHHSHKEIHHNPVYTCASMYDKFCTTYLYYT